MPAAKIDPKQIGLVKNYYLGKDKEAHEVHFPTL